MSGGSSRKHSFLRGRNQLEVQHRASECGNDHLKHLLAGSASQRTARACVDFEAGVEVSKGFPVLRESVEWGRRITLNRCLKRWGAHLDLCQVFGILRGGHDVPARWFVDRYSQSRVAEGLRSDRHCGSRQCD
jgi:hypothetical protein